MKRLLTTLSLSISVMFGQIAPAFAEEVPTAAPPDHVVIAAVQTGQSGAGGNDFVEVYNPTSSPLNITGWKLQYRAASAVGSASWTTKRAVACANSDGSPCTVMLLAKSSIVFATYSLDGIKTQSLSSGLSDTGGQIRIVDANTVAQDMVGYGTAAEAEGGKAAAAPPLGQSLLRKVAAGTIVDTNDNSADFITDCYQPVPAGETMPTLPPMPIACPETDTPANEDVSTTTPTPTDPPISSEPVDTPIADNNSTYAPLTITELFPDPASPQTDSDDEFIELFNSTGAAINAAGYVLETGTDFRYHFTLGDNVVVEPGTYAAITSAESHLSLTNTGTAVRLLDPSGRVIDEVANYGQAKSAQSWAKTNTGWQWSTTPTPGAANMVTTPPTTTSASKTSASTKKAATATKSTAKTTAAKAPKSSTGTKSSAKSAAAAPTTFADDPKSSEGFQSYLLLIPIGLLVVGYVVYEYRKDIAKLYRRLTGGLKSKKDAKEPTLQMD
jgi:hypothetical protein